MPSKIRSKNVSLMWLYTNIKNYKTVATDTRMFMLLFIGTLLCPDLGSTVSLHHLWNLRDIDQIKNYNWGGMAYATLLHFMTQLSQHRLLSLEGAPVVWKFWMYVYFRVVPQFLEDVGNMYPRFLHWLPKYCLSTPPKHCLQTWHMVINNLTADDVSFLCLWILGLTMRSVLSVNGRQVLFEYGHGRYWYLGDWVLAQTSSSEEDESSPSSHVDGSSSSFIETYPHFPTWQYEVMNPDGSYSSMNLNQPEYTSYFPWNDLVGVDLVEESMQMIGGLQLVARTQSSQYVLNEMNWNNQMAMANANTRSLEGRIRNIELQKRQQESPFYANQEGDTEGGSSRDGSRRSSHRRT
ncbi:hypothetical protein SO802_010165 [Lithocarpus litseifolius]|uniref:Aminotransferase-like plant mobile domain-containing protein n=1 Tax=Lithocarpus litseifolius TaxID=425828 RepID=A0AAW2DGH2_9ROSI